MDEPSKDLPATVDGECVVHDHPVPPEEMWRYTFERDPDAENDIANYVSGQARDETVHHVEKIKVEYVLGDPYEIWDVVTDKNRWWVLTNLTNLYSQKLFPSLDYTLSFHIGLMMRMRSRPHGPDATDPQPFDEISRRHEQAEKLYDRAVEPEDYQAVGMQLRESLLSLMDVMRRGVVFSEDTVQPKAADFVAWSKIVLNQLCPGASNKILRQYLKTTAERTWQLVNALTHDKKANETVGGIAMHACSTLIGHSVLLSNREKNDATAECPNCHSRKIRTHFDREIGDTGDYYVTCGSCGWSTHPDVKAA